MQHFHIFSTMDSDICSQMSLKEFSSISALHPCNINHDGQLEKGKKQRIRINAAEAEIWSFLIQDSFFLSTHGACITRNLTGQLVHRFWAGIIGAGCRGPVNSTSLDFFKFYFQTRSIQTQLTLSSAYEPEIHKWL